MSQTYIKSNLHTHSTFCDGKNSLEENILSAIKKGISVLGFTSHSMYPFWTETYMQPKDFKSYCSQIRSLKEKYAGQIQIRLAFEADYIPGITFPRMENYAEFDPDYLIGSIHFIFQRNGLFAVDDNINVLTEGAKKYYRGDFKPLIQDYFAMEREMLDKGDFALLGHPDLIRKFNEKNPFFDENEDWYKKELKNLADEIAKKGIATEINTGAISRGYQSLPYPSEYFLSLLYERRVPLALTADAHASVNLDCAFDLALSLAKKNGYSEIIYDIDKAGYKFCKI
ncbi:MAG: histidinol-phosphatase [Treponema sp.]|nr:histidinol-phosphatase [Treponema sp.]